MAPSGLREQIIAAVEDTEGVLHANACAYAAPGQRYFVDVDHQRAAHGQPRSGACRERSRRKAHRARLSPPTWWFTWSRAPPRTKLYLTRFARLRNARGLAIHELSAHHLDGIFSWTCIWKWTKRGVFAKRTARPPSLKTAIRQATDPGTLVNIHIEPLGTRIPGAEELQGLAFAVQSYVISLHADYPELLDCHEVHVRSVEHKISCPATARWMAACRSRRFTTFTAALESRVKDHFPQICRLTIHPEPVGED